MTTSQLKNLLSDMADEVKPMPVHQRAVARSKRIAVARVTAASISTLVLAGGTIAGVTAVADDGAPTNQQTADGTAPPGSGASKLSGTFYEGTFQQGRGEALRAWETGDDKAEEVIPQGTDDGAYYHTASVSPDGKYLAYLTWPNQDSDNTDKIKIRNLRTGDIEQVAEYSGIDGTCSEPAWTPNGDRLLIDRGTKFDDRTGFVDIESGAFTPFAVDKPCDLKAAEDDRVFSTAISDDGAVEVFVTGSDGAAEPTGAAEVAEQHDVYIRELVAVSPDGRFVCVNTNFGAESGSEEYDDTMNTRFNFCDLIIDTDAGEAIELEGIEGVARTKDGEADERDVAHGSASTFAVPGRLLVEVKTADGEEKQRMYDYQGNPVDEVASATDGEDEPVLGFVPE